MPKVVLSAIVELIDRAYQGSIGASDNQFGGWNSSFGGSLDGLVELVDQIPSELITLNADDFAALVACKSEIRYWVQHWLSRGDAGVFRNVRGYPGPNAITLLRNCLAKCPDTAPSPTTAGLAFVADRNYRELLRTDISSAFSAERNAEWKAATVLAGSVVEALLLLTLQSVPPATVQAHATAARARGFKIDPAAPLEDWGLGQYIEVVKRCAIIAGNTIAQCRLAQEFRNLIHPGKATRTGTACTRATALSALAAVEHVVQDLEAYSARRGMPL